MTTLFRLCSAFLLLIWMACGAQAEEVIRRLQGIRCGMRPTSCPDQLAEALTEALEQI